MNAHSQIAQSGIERLGGLELLERAARGVGKVDIQGARGVTRVSAAEIEAMALVLAILNFPQIAPGEAPVDLQAFLKSGLATMAAAAGQHMGAE